MCRLPYPTSIPPCPERTFLPQAEGWQACCVDCGMVTARKWVDPDGDLLPWCGGDHPGSF